jgi:hypothetical protein
MSAALVVVGVSLVIILMITAVVTRVRRKRVLRQRDETPKEQYRRDQDLRPRHQTSLGGRGDAAEAPRPVLRPEDLAALVQGAVQNAPERELVGDYRRLRRAKKRRKVWAAGTAETLGANYGGDGGVPGGGGWVLGAGGWFGDGGGGDCGGDGGSGGGSCGGGGDC